MYRISIMFDKSKVPSIFKDINYKICLAYRIDDNFLIVTDGTGNVHYFRKDCIVAFHIEYNGGE